MLDTIIKINADHLIGKMVDFLFVCPYFIGLGLKRGKLLVQLPAGSDAYIRDT